MEKYLPIIYVRGYAGSQGAVESTVDRPYYGFNLGSTQVRTGPDGDPDFFIFESPLVHLVAHSMGGLICRSLIQRVLKQEAAKKIDRVFTYATPHRGIHFRRGLGFLTGVRDLLGLNDSNTFGPVRMREFLGFSKNWDENRLNEMGGLFPVDRIFSLIGTNHTDYKLARLAVGPGSDVGDGRLVGARWAGLDSDLPATGKRYPRNDNIRFPLPSKNLAQGDLVLRVRDERSNATQHLL
jgi:hypothetical protein